MMHIRSRRSKILGRTAISLVAILVVITAGVFAAVRLELSGITHLTRIDSHTRPPKYTNALNVMLLGSDTRTGRNGAIGGPNGCACSDTIMIAHFSPGRGNVTVVSIPRDTVVPLYACSAWNGTPGQHADPYAVERINATLAAGGPECVRETVERQTGIYINDVIELNFTGFEQVINDIGGVNVCLPFAIHNVITASEGSGLDLKAGEHHIDGRVALEFWRTRYNVADGSDIATSLRHISASDVQFITAPWTSYPYDPNEVEFAQPQADAMFWALAHDTALPPTGKKSHLRTESVKGQRNGPIDEGPAGHLLTLIPSQVKVLVLNGSSRGDRTSQAEAGLTSRGFDVLGTGYASATGYRDSVIEYGRIADLAAARTLRGQVPSASLKLVPGLAAGTVDLVLGSRFTKLAAAKPTSRRSITSLSNDYGGITARVSCRNRAFYASNGVSQGRAGPCRCG